MLNNGSIRYEQQGPVTESVVLEIRGVGGATPEEILGGSAVQVSGDKLAGFFRPDPEEGRSRNLPDGDHVIVEAYEWGRLTSGTWSTALWWILLPFTLMNVAGWTFRPLNSEFDSGPTPPLGPQGRAVKPGRSTLWWARIVILGGGLGLSALYAAWAAVISADLIGLTCGGNDTCSTAWYMGPFRWFGTERVLEGDTIVMIGHPTWRLAAGMTLAALLMFVLLWFIRRTQDHLEGFEPDPRYREAGDRNDARVTRNTNLEDGGFWYRWGEYRRLFRWHLATIVAVLGGIAGYGYVRLGSELPDPAWPIWIAVLLFVCMIFLLSGAERFHANPTGAEDIERWRQFGWTAVHTAVATMSFLFLSWLMGRYGDTGDRLRLVIGIRWLSTLLFLTAIVLLFLLAIRSIGVRFSESTFVSRSESFGMPLIAAALAVYVSGVGWGAVTHLLGRYLVGADELTEGSFETSLVDLFVLALVVTAIGIVLYRLVSGPKKHDIDGVLEEYHATLASSARVRSWAKGIASARWTAMLPSKADRILGVLVGLLIVAQFIQTYSYEGLNFAFWHWSESSFGIPLFDIESLRWLHPIASAAVVLYLFPGADIIRRMAASRNTRRQLGKIWDVLSFWPRRFHPLAAPCYAERAVPEFRDRIKRHLSQGRPVVVSAHSQGTVIAFAALLQIAGEEQERPADHPDEPSPAAEAAVRVQPQPHTEGWYKQASTEAHLPTDHVIELPALPEDEGPLRKAALVTFGSPLSSLYGPFFPRYFGMVGRFQAIRRMLASSPADSTDHAWRNFARCTDFIGREVFIEPGGVLDPAPIPPPDVMLREARHVLLRNEAHSNYEYEPRLRAWVLDVLAHFGALTTDECREQKRLMLRAHRRVRPE